MRTPSSGDPSRALSAVRDADDDAHLQESLRELAELTTAELELTAVLARVATFAAHAIPGADGVGVTLLLKDRPGAPVEALGASTAFVSDIDRLQYVSLHEGPCITAAIERRTVRSGSLGGAHLWPRFGPRAGRLGVHSALSLPLLLPDRVVGTINVYARGKDSFDDQAVGLGEAFARPAAVTVSNAQALDHALRLTAQLQTALSTRPVIDQAIGLLRGRSGASTKEAFGRLRSISQAEHRKLAEVAQQVVDEAVRRAHARRAQER